MKQIFSRMGDGSALWLSEDELRHELRSGSEDAADRGKIAPLNEGELERLYEICAEPRKVVSVEPGHEVVHSFDAGSLKFPLRGGVPVDRLGTVMAHERAFCSDTFEVGHSDYSFKPVKAIISEERQSMEQIQLNATIPVYYGAMPNLGLYTDTANPPQYAFKQQTDFIRTLPGTFPDWRYDGCKRYLFCLRSDASSRFRRYQL